MNISRIKNPSTGYKQKGGSIIGLLIKCGFILFIVYLCLKIMPEYSKHSNLEYALKASLENIDRPAEFHNMKFFNSMRNYLVVEGNDIHDLEDHTIITKSKSSVKVDIKYEKKVPLFYNMGIYLDFETSAEKQ